MPTFIHGTNLKHICNYCFTLHIYQHGDTNAARFKQFRCDGCTETFTDFDPETSLKWQDFLDGKTLR